MGVTAENVAKKYNIDRTQQQEFAISSHEKANNADTNGKFEDEITIIKDKKVDVIKDGGIRPGTNQEVLSGLKLAFDNDGTVTAGTSSPLTDGAAATLIMSESKALELGYKPKAYLNNWTFAAVDPFEEMLLGPTYATSKVLDMAGVSLDEIDVVEFHEAFAGQVLANFNAMASDEFGWEKLGRTGAVGTMQMDRVNPHGGSLSLGHPFGATGARLVTTAANRLQREGGKLALVAACADGGVGHACVLERYPQ